MPALHRFVTKDKADVASRHDFLTRHSCVDTRLHRIYLEKTTEKYPWRPLEIPYFRGGATERYLENLQLHPRLTPDRPLRYGCCVNDNHFYKQIDSGSALTIRTEVQGCPAIVSTASSAAPDSA